MRGDESFARIASDYGVELHAISEINTGHNWSWLTKCDYPIRERYRLSRLPRPEQRKELAKP